MPKLITDLAVMLLTAGIVTILFRRLGQPLVLGYILAGFLVGPYMPFFFTVADSASIETWSEIGIIVLMFGLGLEFNLHKLASVGGTAVITALTEVLGMLVLGYLVGQAMGWPMMDSIFLGGMLSMSSTTIIIKAFDELGVRKQPFAELVFGTLVIEDIAGIFMLVTQAQQIPQMSPWVVEIMSKASDSFKNDPYVKEYLDAANYIQNVQNGLEAAPGATSAPAPEVQPVAPTPNEMAAPSADAKD